MTRTFTPYIAPPRSEPDPTLQARYDELERCRADLGRFVLSLIDAPGDVEEVLQEIYLKVWRALPHTPATSYMWLRRIARNAAFDYLRRCKVRRDHSSLFPLEDYEETLVDGPLSQPDVLLLARERLEETLAPLASSERAVLMLVDGTPGVYEAISKATQRSRSSVARILYQSRKKLKAAGGAR